MKLRSAYQLLLLLKQYRAALLVGVVLSLLPAYFHLWTPYLIGRFVDDVLVSESWSLLSAYAGIFIFVVSCTFFFGLVVNYLMILLGLRVLVEYRFELVQKLLRFRVPFFDRWSSGTLSTRLTSDVNSLNEFFSTAMVSLIGNILLIGAILGLLFYLDWRLTCIIVSVLFVLGGLTAVFHRRIRRRFSFSRKTLGHFNALLGDYILGRRDLDGLGSLDHIRNEYSRWSAKHVSRQLRGVREYSIYQPTMAFFISIQNLLILGVGGWFVIDRQMSIGELVSFLAYANYFGWPLQEFAEKVTVFQQALAAVDRLVELQAGEPESTQGDESLHVFSQLEFKDVSFRFQSAQTLSLDQVNWQLKAGEKIGIVGETGAGKSTLCSLIMRFYEPTSGRILVDGKDLQSVRLADWRAGLAWVSQDVQLFSASLRENIRFFDPSVSDERVLEALRIAQLEDWYRGLENGLDSIIAEKGAELSSGQRQMISIARAACARPRILILDEATAYIDSSTEWQFQKALEVLWASDLFQSITVLVVAHRWSTLKRCDRVISLDRGRLEEVGTYEDLLSRNSYSRAPTRGNDQIYDVH